MNKLKKNFLYNIVYQILILIIPLITMPYVSRIIGSTGLGIYSYTYSIVYYFMIFAMLGFNNYGNRSIAKVRDDKELLTRTFKEIYLTQFLTSLTMIFIFLMFILLFVSEYKLFFMIQLLHLISCMFDVNWFFFGIENFKLTVTRNTLIKILTLILIFIFVRTPNDIWIYTLILGGSTLISNIVLWPFLKKYLAPDIKIAFKDCKKHFIPCLKLFLPVIAVAIYKVMDKTMLGVFSNVDEVGFYESAEKIVNVPITVITALGTIMLPHMTNLYAKGEIDAGKEMISKSINIMMFLAFSMTFGVIAISRDFALIFFGLSFTKTGLVMMLLSITILFLSWGNVIRTQYLIPKEMDKEYIVSAFLGAVINLIMNIIFIPIYGSIGACIGTIFAEFVVSAYQTIAVRKVLPIGKYLYDVLPFFIKSIFMFIVIIPISLLPICTLFKVILQVIIGTVIYLLFNLKYIKNILNYR